MTRIAIVGAGGYVFPLRLIGDLLSFPALQDSTLVLMDVDPDRLARTTEAARELVRHHALPTNVVSTTDQREAVRDADFVIITFQVGGVEAYRHDVEIPRRYGLDQPVGDTLGPGGVFRFLRSVTAYRTLVSDILELCPGTLCINYANPMAMATWFLNLAGVRTVGLCHSVQNTSRMLARELSVPYEEINYISAGINHQAWFLRFEHNNLDLYPRLRETMATRHLTTAPTTEHGHDDGDHSEAAGPSVYEGGVERVRTELMAKFGYFHTESSHHSSEYVPYFRKNKALIEKYIPQRWDYYELCAAHDEQGQTTDLLERLKEELAPSLEYGARIVNSSVTGQPTVIYGNVTNSGLIDNLPAGCCVEVPCLVDNNGLQPTVVGPLPPQLAALNQNAINVQRLAVEAAITSDREHVYHAVMLDPLTAALLTLDQIVDMVDELFAAHADSLVWLDDSRRPANASIS
ncbi:MAG: alpha-glucosidase/alpha-galactosidase [Propionibacteriaceae bacterium]